MIKKSTRPVWLLTMTINVPSPLMNMKKKIDDKFASHDSQLEELEEKLETIGNMVHTRLPIVQEEHTPAYGGWSIQK